VDLLRIAGLVRRMHDRMRGGGIAVDEDDRLQLGYLARQIRGLRDAPDHIFARTDLTVAAGRPLVGLEQTFEKLGIAAIFRG
jgi:hypothetical protein